MVEKNYVPIHKDLQRSRIKKDEEAITAVVEVIQGWNNPFSDSQQELVSISTAKAPPNDVKLDLKKSHEIGEKCYAAFQKGKTPQLRTF